MIEGPYIAEAASLIGDPARANMLTALMDGGALTATELSYVAGITQQTASSHLKKLSEAGLVALERQGRHRYYRLSSPDVARALEALMVLSHQVVPRKRATGPKDPALRHARTCYDHLAGELGVRITDALVSRGLLEEGEEDFALTPTGRRFFSDLGLDLAGLEAKRRALSRRCLDWSERRPHLGGSLGAGLLAAFEERAWLRRQRDSRGISVTPEGRQALKELLSVDA